MTNPPDKTYRRHHWQVNVVANDKCPACRGELDTGYECLDCRADWVHLAAEAEKRKREAERR